MLKIVYFLFERSVLVIIQLIVATSQASYRKSQGLILGLVHYLESRL